MNHCADRTTAQTYFDRFAAAFSTFDGGNVADLFAIPGVALGGDGSIVGLTNREDAVHYYQAALDRYRSQGCRTARWSRLETTPMGRRSLLATVTWELLREDGSIARRWRQSYNIRNLGDGDPRTFASAMHAE
jgi:hypothetical protein